MLVYSLLRQGLFRLLEAICVCLLSGLVVLIVTAVISRKLGHSLPWYDEIASLMLAWLSYYGAALAALHRAHLGFGGFLVKGLRPRARLTVLAVSEGLIITFFALLAWSGWEVLMILRGDTLTSLPWIPLTFAQSVIPIGAVMFIAAESLAFVETWADIRSRPHPEAVG